MLNILLLANYRNDRQESMLRFAGLLESELGKSGVKVDVIRPEPYFGRIKQGGTGLGKWLGYLDKFLIFPFALTRRVRRMRGGDFVVHICDHSNAFYTRWLQATPHLVTCNDLLAIRSARGEFPGHVTGFTGKWLQNWICSGLMRAMRITCISQETMRDLLRLPGISPEKVDVTYMGLNHPYAPMPRAEALARVEKLLGGDEPYLLHVGGNQWYKNRIGVLGIHAALEELTRAPKLVMVGPAFDREMGEFMERHPKAAANVIPLTDVDNETLRALYSAAELVLFPSLEEGFGWPIVEAQACGCRVVTTQKAPMTEAGGDAAFYLPGREFGCGISEWAEGAAKVVAGALAQADAERAEMIAKGLENAKRFGAAAMAQRYLAIYRELLYKP
ncbi:MAG: glycosyltransferase family 1 protein [Chthoniobacteraceae bacterium]